MGLTSPTASIVKILALARVFPRPLSRIPITPIAVQGISSRTTHQALDGNCSL